MGVHFAAYYKSFGTSYTKGSLVLLSPIPDGILTQSGNSLQMTTALAVVAGFVGGKDTGGTIHVLRAQLQSPTFRKFTNPDVRPVSGAASPADADPLNIFSLLGNPLNLPCGASLSVAAATDADNAASTPTAFSALALIALADRLDPPPAGDSYTISATFAPSAATGSWALAGDVTWQNDLPPGRYGIIGIDAFGSTKVVAVRLTNPKSPGGLRPGTVCVATARARPASLFSDGDLGLLAEFDSLMMPGLECLALADAHTDTVTVDLRVVPLSGKDGCGC